MTSALAVTLIAALINDITFEIDNFTAERGISTITLRVTNDGQQLANQVFINCVFMTEDMKTIDIGRALIINLAPGQTKYEQAAIARTTGVEEAKCYIDQVN
jgi:hypothetical protein